MLTAWGKMAARLKLPWPALNNMHFSTCLAHIPAEDGSCSNEVLQLRLSQALRHSVGRSKEKSFPPPRAFEYAFAPDCRHSTILSRNPCHQANVSAQPIELRSIAGFIDICLQRTRVPHVTGLCLAPAGTPGSPPQVLFRGWDCFILGKR